jgi:hypothetical protein
MHAIKLVITTFNGISCDAWLPWSDGDIPLCDFVLARAAKLNADYSLKFDSKESVISIALQVYETDAKILKSGKAVGGTVFDPLNDSVEICYAAKDMQGLAYGKGPFMQ